MRRIFSAVLFAFAIILATAGNTFAQSAPSSNDSVGSVGLTYSVLHMQSQTAPFGFALDFSRRIVRSANNVNVHIAGDVSVNRFKATDDFDASTQSAFMVGVRLAGGKGNAKPFAQAMFGALHCCGATDKALMFGAGVDVRATDKMNFRIQIDVPVDYYAAGTDENDAPYAAGHQTGVRINVGVSIPIRK